MLRPLQANEIGGAVVNRAFTIGSRKVVRGASTDNGGITIEEIRAMPTANRNAMIENRFLSVWPAGASVAPIVANGKKVIPPAGPIHPDTACHIVSRGFGKFDVIEGRILAKDASKVDATKIAAEADAARVKIAAEAKTEAPTKAKRDRKKKSSSQEQPQQ